MTVVPFFNNSDPNCGMTTNYGTGASLRSASRDEKRFPSSAIA
jgi:hypothetical protein